MSVVGADDETGRIDLVVKWPPNSDRSAGRPAPNDITIASKYARFAIKSVGAIRREMRE
jgi:hypothetical protein